MWLGVVVGANPVTVAVATIVAAVVRTAAGGGEVLCVLSNCYSYAEFDLALPQIKGGRNIFNSSKIITSLTHKYLIFFIASPQCPKRF